MDGEKANKLKLLEKKLERVIFGVIICVKKTKKPRNVVMDDENKSDDCCNF